MTRLKGQGAAFLGRKILVGRVVEVQFTAGAGIFHQALRSGECAERIGGLALPRFVADIPGAARKTPIEEL